MSRFDRRLKGASKKGNGARPGTAVCSLPASSTPNTGILAGNLLTRQQRARHDVSNTRKINGLAILQMHEQKITGLENKLGEFMQLYSSNASYFKTQIKEREDKYAKLTHQHEKQYQSMSSEIMNLKQKIDKMKKQESKNLSDKQ